MNAIRIRRTVDSDTLHLPELCPFVGKEVEIIVLVEPSSASRPAWEAAVRAADGLADYDFEAYRRQRDFDRQHADDHLP